MAGSMKDAISRRQLRFIGNKNTISSKHSQGNKGTTSPGNFGRASSQAASAKGGTTYQGGAEFGASKNGGSGSSVTMPGANAPTGYRGAVMDTVEDKARGRTSTPDGIPSSFKPSKGSLSRRQKGGK